MNNSLLMTSPSTLRGGAEEHALTVATAAVNAGWHVYAGFPDTPATVALLENFCAVGVNYCPLDIADTSVRELKKFGDYLPHFARMLGILLKIRPNVVQINLPYPDRSFGVILACAFLKVPTAVVFHLVPPTFSLTPTMKKIHAWVRKRNQQWIVISENNRELVGQYFLLSQLEKEQIACIYNGTETSKITNVDLMQTRSQVREELGLPQTSKILLTVGRLDEQKGYQDLVCVVGAIVAAFADVRFVWVGEGDSQEFLETSLEQLGVRDRVFLLGYRSDVPRLLNAADLFVFPTHYEGGQSIALSEAMAHALPIVASDASGIPEAISDGIHGKLFPVGDRECLQETICWALNHPQAMQEMASNAKLRAQDFSLEKMVKSYLNLWQRLSQQSRS
jgi:glycosyltransferase involved in cell wall biosynthesis